MIPDLAVLDALAALERKIAQLRDASCGERASGLGGLAG
jgi:hypothetical protein